MVSNLLLIRSPQRPNIRLLAEISGRLFKLGQKPIIRLKANLLAERWIIGFGAILNYLLLISANFGISGFESEIQELVGK